MFTNRLSIRDFHKSTGIKRGRNVRANSPGPIQKGKLFYFNLFPF